MILNIFRQPGLTFPQKMMLLVMTAVTVLISLTVLAEPVAPLQLVGGTLILAFTLANELGAARA